MWWLCCQFSCQVLHGLLKNVSILCLWNKQNGSLHMLSLLISAMPPKTDMTIRRRNMTTRTNIMKRRNMTKRKSMKKQEVEKGNMTVTPTAVVIHQQLGKRRRPWSTRANGWTCGMWLIWGKPEKFGNVRRPQTSHKKIIIHWEDCPRWQGYHIPHLHKYIFFYTNVHFCCKL